MSLHCHFSTSATDCDGRIDRDYIMVSNEGQDEYDFRSFVLGMLIGLGDGTLTQVTGESAGLPWTRLEWSEPTEEGHHYGEALLCQDDCDLEEHHYRDHQAEAAGY